MGDPGSWVPPTSAPDPESDAGLAASLRGLTRDGRLLFATRFLRMFGYGFLAVVLVLYLSEIGLEPAEIGLLLTLILVGDIAVSLVLTTSADRLGRRRVLIAGSLLMAIAGTVFAATSWLPLLLVAGIVGVLSPTGNEVGPFLAVEQSSLSQTIVDARRTATFAWYNVCGYAATAVGALAAGIVSQGLVGNGLAAVDAYRAVVIGYALVGLAMASLFRQLGPEIEIASSSAAATPGIRRRLGLGRSKGVVARLSALFAVDAFAGGFVPQSLIAYWFHLQFAVPPAILGLIFFAANLLAAVSSLSAARIAGRIGLVNTMVFTHLPSNVLLILVPFMPTLPLAVGVLLARYVLSQMDVPTRQSYVIAVVDPDERSAAAGVTGIARTAGAAISPALSTPLVASASLAGVPFILAGGLKIVYDLSLWVAFRARPAPGERGRMSR